MAREVEKLRPPEKPFNVLLQQLFLFLHHHPRSSRRKISTELLSHPVFGSISRKELDQVFRHLVAGGYITADGEMLMPGTEAERVLGRSNWKDLYSVISGGGEYRAMTPEGELVGKLDARFVNSRSEDGITLGGREWSMVKCDEGHNIVVVVPSGSGASRTFWTGSGGDNGLSPLVCERIEMIRMRGESVLPLGDREKEQLQPPLLKIPEGTGTHGLYILERNTPGRREVVVYSLHGSRFNRVLAILLRKCLGAKARSRSTDFVVRVTGTGKTGAGKKVASALESVRSMNRDEIGAMLPIPPRDGWKFAGLLPDNLFSACAFSDYYHIGEFFEELSSMEIRLLPTPDPVPPGMPE
jgi:ATP-dependent Lhr-like helicase